MTAILAAIRLGLAELALHRAYEKAERVYPSHDDDNCRLCAAVQRERDRVDTARRRMWACK